MDEILFGFFEPGNSYYRKRSAYTALSAIAEIRRAVAEPRITQQTQKLIHTLKDEELPYAIALVVSVSECWRALIDVHRGKLVEYMREGPLEMVARLAERAAQLEQFRDAVAERVRLSDVNQLSVLIEGGLRELAVAQAVEYFCNCQSWDSANFIWPHLIAPLLMNLNYAHIKQIIEASSVPRVDLRCSGGFAEFLIKIREEGLIKEEELNALLKENHLDERGYPC